AGVYHHLVPDAAGRALGSRRLVWLQLWLLVLVTGFTGPRLLLHGTAPGWLQSIGVAAGLLAWAPGWAGLLAGASTALVVDARRARGPELSFAMAAAVALAIGGLDLTLTSLRSFAGLVQFTDWSGGQRHLVGLGWLGFMAAAV